MQEQYLSKELNIVLTSSEYCLCPPRLMISPSSDILEIECVFLHLLKKIQRKEVRRIIIISNDLFRGQPLGYYFIQL